MANYTYLISGDTVFIAAEGKSWVVSKADGKKMDEVLRLIKEDASLAELKKVLDCDSGERLRKWCEEQLDGNDAGISVGSDTVEIDGKPVYGSLCRQIIEMNEQGFPLDPLVNFVRKMRQNPSYRIREQLWGFIEACQKDGGFTLHTDGDIMAYKVVRNDFTDCHTGTFDNHPGKVVEMPRCEVDDDPHHTCSTGLHFCAYSYVGGFISVGDRLVLVKVNPKDVVSIPEDYGNAKARCCRYEVVSEVSKPVKEPVYRNGEQTLKTSDDAVYSIRLNSKKERYVFKDPNANLPFEIDDVVLAETPDYDGDIHIGRIVAQDIDDKELEWCIRFVDHEKNCVVNWWVNGENLCYPSKEDANAEDFSLMDDPDRLYPIHHSVYDFSSDDPEDVSPKFSKGDKVKVTVSNKDANGIVAEAFEVSDRILYLVQYENFDGKTVEVVVSEDDLEPASKTDNADLNFFDDFSKECLEDEISDIVKKVGKEGADALKAFLGILLDAETKAETSKSKADSEDENPELWVESWLDASDRQTIGLMLESEFKEMMQNRLTARLALASSSFSRRIIKAEIEMWMAEQKSILSSNDLWKEVQSRIRHWAERHGA